MQGMAARAKLESDTLVGAAPVLEVPAHRAQRAAVVAI